MKIFTLSIMVCFIVSSLSARIWTLDNTPGNTAADFTNFQDAVDAAQSGDSIYVQGSAIAYGHLGINKKVAIFGPGYFLSENDSTQVNKNPAMTSYITFGSGSEGSLITGMSLRNILRITATDSIKVFRNHIRVTFGAYMILLSSSTNCVIMQNYIQSTYDSGHGISLTTSANNNLIKNNIFDLLGSGPVSILMASSCYNNIVQNNVLNGNLQVYNSEISNNILLFGSYSGTGNMLMNNMCNGTQFEDLGENNLIEIDMETVFVDTGSTDGQWQIKTNGPAVGTGTNGTDMGMFGGNDPYILSGIPPLPTIYEFYGTNAGATTFPVQIKIKARK